MKCFFMLLGSYPKLHFSRIVITTSFLVTMQAQKEAPPDMQCKDKFLLQAVVAPHGATVKDITADMVSRFFIKVLKYNSKQFVTI